ncbi:amino acid adenylation domain-containing protein [Nocardia sp. 2]|uniref:Amino acid adenylation domain-containing protein n=1 Tax=Nocardia acididurans TaxID=2802282 RepID=A0ABS1M5V3_9NOCA|nr:amino acid adenylation domain-containing protein [Nocardia acididurans]MBL1075899.1 amino acid adenylation domain-containing protein [Nocardia acididurans]
MTARLLGTGERGVVRLPAIESVAHACRPALLGRRPVSYGELAKTVHLLAAGLQGLGAVVGDRVVIWMDKGPEYAAAILATLQAGCAYVPVDGAHPVRRLQAILDDIDPIVLVTDARHLAEVGSDIALPHTVRAVVVSAERAASDTACAQADGSRARVIPWREFLLGAGRGPAIPARPPVVTPADLAAVLYTSGSTGTPKGVRISHRNLTAFIDWARAELALGPEDVFANHASFTFDLSTFDLFVAVSVGAAVWIIEDAQARDAAALVTGIREHGVTVWYSVPSILMLLTACGALTAEVVASLRYVLFAGEVYPKPRLRELHALLDERTRLYNLYGPTETNVCTYHRVLPEDLGETGSLPIGMPVGTARMLIVDDDGQPIDGPDAFGELVVEGDCVTPGYWRRESDPRGAFHRRGQHPTGDMVSRSDGRLRYHGRKDRMVKLSGYRIELGEIESVALRHPAVETAAVLVTGAGAEARIVLYYTLRPGAQAPTLIELKQHCALYLPRYMVPRAAVVMAELPRNANGKTDYRSLGNP